MAKRSLQASGAGIKKAKQLFLSKGWTQAYLAHEVGVKTRQPIWRFFAGQAIERYTFFEICTRLDLDWREIAHNPPAESIDWTDDETINIANLSSSPLSLDALVQTVRSRREETINHQCAILQLFDISRPVSIDHIYTDVNILEQIASQQWLETDAIDRLPPEEVDRFGLDNILKSQITGRQAVEKYSKLRVLGKPGSGKSTFLKYLAIQCNRGHFAITQVPIFITLRDLAESYRDHPHVDLLEFIHQEFINSNISQLEIVKKLLQSGRMLLLIDGMDEVPHENGHIILNEIRRFCDKYHRNQFVATCRTASQKLLLQGFTDVEIAPFTEAQIIAFAQKWFIEFSRTNDSKGMANASQFMMQLELPENWRFRWIITTPLFLHLACSLFQCQDKFPTQQSEFYKQCMDLLLEKWDESRGIKRDQIYQGFSLSQKLKLLSQIALITFEQGQYFFKEEVIEQHISDYLQSLPDPITDSEESHQTSIAILRALESQHGLLVERARGVFSFSYLALQEYFAARKIVASHHLHRLGDSL